MSAMTRSWMAGRSFGTGGGWSTIWVIGVGGLSVSGGTGRECIVEAFDVAHQTGLAVLGAVVRGEDEGRRVAFAVQAHDSAEAAAVRVLVERCDLVDGPRL